MYEVIEKHETKEKMTDFLPIFEPLEEPEEFGK